MSLANAILKGATLALRLTAPEAAVSSRSTVSLERKAVSSELELSFQAEEEDQSAVVPFQIGKAAETSSWIALVPLERATF